MRSFRTYKFIHDGENFKVLSVKHDLSDVKLKDIIKENTHFHDQLNGPLPLPTNKVSRLIGVFKGRLRKMSYTPRYTEDLVAKDILENYCPEFRSININYKTQVFPGSWKYNCSNLTDMATDHTIKYDWRSILKGYFSRKDVDLVLPHIPFYNVDSILGIKTKRESFPGILTAELYGNKRKNTIGFTKGIAHSYARYIMESSEQVLDTSLLYVGGREKRVKVKYGEVKNCKTRIVLGQEDIPTLISTSLSKSLNEAFQIMDRGFNFGGRVNGRLNFRDLIDDLKIDDRFDINFNVDFSGHDNNVSEEAIVAAYSLLRLCFPVSTKIDRIFYYVMSGMIFKRIVLPDSKLIYQISKGIATGHGLTNIINTLCSYGTFATAMHRTCSQEEINNSVLRMAGDDVIGKLPLTCVDKVATDLKQFSGMIMDDIRDTSGHLNSLCKNTRNTFLKKKYVLGGLSWNNIELFTNLTYPTSTKLTPHRRIDNYTQMAVQAPFDPEINNTMLFLSVIVFLQESFLSNSRSSYNICDPPPENIFDYIIMYYRKCSMLTNYVDYSEFIPDVFNMYSEEYHNSIPIDLKWSVLNFINEFRTKVSSKSSWFTLRRHFRKHEKVVRLKVFDVNKVFVKAKPHTNLDKVINSLMS